jgi:uncharacterized phage protein gp47/JayE
MGTLTATGFQKDRLETIRAELQAAFRAQFGNGLVVDETNPLIVVEGIISERLSLLEELLEGVYDSQYVSTSGDISLDRVLSMRGHKRQGATNSAAPFTYAAGTPLTTITNGSVVSVTDTGEFFEVDADYTLGNVADKSVVSVTSVGTTATVTTTAAHGLINGDKVFIRGANQSEYNILATVANAVGSTFDYEFAGSATSPATGTIFVKWATQIGLVAQNTGPVQALAGSLVTIEDTILGWDIVENLADADLGQDEETDAEFRARSESILSTIGGGTLEAIKATLLNVAGVTNTIVFENDTGDFDGLRPPYSIECFVSGGTDNDVAQGIFDSKSAGVRTYGNSSDIINDSEGNPHTINFSRLTLITIYIDVTIVKNTVAEDGPIFDDIGGPDAIKQAIVDYGDTLEAGQDVWVNNITAAVTSVPGVKSITTLLVDTVFPPVASSNIAISIIEIANIDSANIDVTVT